jgi:hypothetical protein
MLLPEIAMLLGEPATVDLAGLENCWDIKN